MTGNKIAWRAPLAGLASVAMIATMGVAASTANADVPVNDNDQYFRVAIYAKDAPSTAIKTYDSYTYGKVFSTFAGLDLKDPYKAVGDGKILTGYSYDLAGQNVAKAGFAVKGDTKLYAQYADAVTVTFKNTAFGDISFDVAKGAGVTAADYTRVTEPAAPAGQVFAGWKLTDDADAQDIYQGEALNADTVLYPVFAKYATLEDQNNVAKVFFDTPGTSDGDVAKYSADNKPFPAYRAPKGTWLDASGNSYDFSAKLDSDVSSDVDTSDTAAGADLTLEKATSASDKSWTVRYEFDGANPTNSSTGMFITDDTVDVDYAADDKAEQPSDPAKKMAMFTGWYASDNTPVDFDTPVSQLPGADASKREVTVHAGWDTKGVVPVVYYYGYKAEAWQLPTTSAEANNKVVAKTGKAIEYVTKGNKLPDPANSEDYFQTSADIDHNTYSARKLVAWRSVNDDAVISKVTAKAAVYAQWAGAVAILLNGNGGEFSNGNNYIYATKADGQSWKDVVETPTRPGYNFAFWQNEKFTTKTLRANLVDGYYYELKAGEWAKTSLKISDDDQLVAVWSEAANDELAAFAFKYGLSYRNEDQDVAKLTNDGYTKASAEKFVAESYDLYDQYLAYTQLSGQARKDAAKRLNAAYADAERLLVRSDQAEAPAGTTPVYRAFNPNEKRGGSHLYTTNYAEYQNVVRAGWLGEGVQFYTTTSKKATPVYRVYNRNDGSHHLTVSKGEAEYLVSLGWADEDIAFYVADDADAPAYRAYNPNSGEHVFTTSKAEVANLVAYGWNDEGVAFNVTAK